MKQFLPRESVVATESFLSGETLTDSVNGTPSWYKKGLQFECTQCGDCCKDEGYVLITEAERDRMAENLGMSVEEFSNQFVRELVGDNGLKYLGLTEHEEHRGCVFFDDDRGCTIYEARPEQCKTFPFWKEYLSTPSAWEEASRRCEGVNTGKTFSKEEIDRRAAGSPFEIVMNDTHMVPQVRFGDPLEGLTLWDVDGSFVEMLRVIRSIHSDGRYTEDGLEYLKSRLNGSEAKSEAQRGYSFRSNLTFYEMQTVLSLLSPYKGSK